MYQKLIWNVLKDETVIKSQVKFFEENLMHSYSW